MFYLQTLFCTCAVDVPICIAQMHTRNNERNVTKEYGIWRTELLA